MSKGKAMLEKCRVHRRTNLKAARLIIQDRAKYAGLPVVWAEIYLKKHSGVVSG